MSLKSRMHPRNIYRTPPNFKLLAIEYPEFMRYVKQDLTGRISLDYNDRNAVMELTRILLLKDFNLRVEINESRLIPRVPLCLNYVLWVEDLLSSLSKNDITGIDIGTGSICIYSLLASTKGWKMLATEIDSVSYEKASENVRRNNLTDKIKLKLNDDPNKLLNGVIDDDSTYDFCMCNPPFFDKNEKVINRTRKRKMLETVATYVDTEIVTKGGEYEFITKLIKESQILRDRVKIYTTLVGKKSDYFSLKKDISKIEPAAMTDTEFCQGNTTRWGLAWSFSDLTFQSIQESRSKKAKKSNPKPLEYIVSKENSGLTETLEKLEKILSDLKVSVTKGFVRGSPMLTLKAYENTWCHQRRKNRLKARQQMKAEKTEEDCEETDSSSCEDPSVKKIKLQDVAENRLTCSTSKIPLVECMILLTEEFKDIIITFSWSSGNKEYVHQILQYVKNNWSKTDDNDTKKENTD